MPRYASETTVTVERSKAEIEETLIRYGATAFTSGWRENEAMIAFQLKKFTVRFVLPIPPIDDKRFKFREVRGYQKRLTESQQRNAWEQERRSRWRALLLTVKAKLEAVDCGITTIENEFMAFIVLPSGQTLGSWITDNAFPQITSGKMPMLIGDGNIEDAEIVTKEKS